MLQLQLTQPHILTTIITSKRRQVLYLSITYSMSFDGSYFILSFSIDLDWWHVSVNAVVLPITSSSETWNTLCTPRKAAREDRSSLYAVLPIRYVTDEWTYKPIPELSSAMQSQVARRQQDFGANLKLSMPA